MFKNKIFKFNFSSSYWVGSFAQKYVLTYWHLITVENNLKNSFSYKYLLLHASVCAYNYFPTIFIFFYFQKNKVTFALEPSSIKTSCQLNPILRDSSGYVSDLFLGKECTDDKYRCARMFM